ncbi:diguanylate cyclase (GGDEF) domain-containing protein [Halolactibacillus halophilus]|uniref:Diguanylate cyclase (GGDEF) domain-containing protein n=1 Tax=Halolactibacillus halophilus TaxID=306540 RepID=A0A1I5SGM2_9BACI|nr:sensor domain-containing diguanylate cyclase [Halolactibacillus halophilus]SFP69869.1 diguanylate cyclase (GGDEF) domain-containing protein [Halolactibacillus halophilus]
MFHVVSHNETEKVYVSQIEDVALELKKDFLKDTVNNTITQIDRLRASKQEVYQLNTDKRLERLLILAEDMSEAAFVDLYEREFQMSDDQLWTAYLFDHETDTFVFSTEANEKMMSRAEIEATLATKVVIEKGTLTGVFGVSYQYIDAIIQSDIKEIIHHQTYENDAYIWVNEVVNYEGGKDYAIRRIHPNLIETEGDYLSTTMTDVVGGTPYLTELNGINRNSELFFSYYFKKLQSDNVSKKITYAKLYEPYDWIVAMGVHLDDLDGYVSQVREESEKLLTRMVLNVLLYLISALVLGFVLIYVIMEHNLRKSTKQLLKEASTDPLTGAESRRYGERVLAHQFDTYHVKKKQAYIAMFDIDDFKLINDQYGHEAGDQVLQHVVTTVQKILADDGQLIRWGGDEFVVMMDRLSKDESIMRLDQMLYFFETHPIELEMGTITLSLSIGLTTFLPKDRGYQTAVKRADSAMYESKQHGKCKLTVSC